jgi:predicted amidohydrolase YtcJ
VLRSATIDAAYMIARDEEIGSLEPGKLADLIVLKDDIFSNPPETLFKTRVMCTVVGGKVVWQDA